MNQRVQHKIEEYRRMAGSQKGHVAPSRSVNTRQDSLAMVIRSKKDADEFMTELDNIVKRSR